MWAGELSATSEASVYHYFADDAKTLCGRPRSDFDILYGDASNERTMRLRCLVCSKLREQKNPPTVVETLIFNAGGTASADGTAAAAALAKPKGDRFNEGKWDPTFWPREALEAGSRVWAYGAKKYARDNWRSGMPQREIAACAGRHITAWVDGEDNDAESGLNHIWHALCNLAMLCWMIARRPDLDDRWKGEHQASKTKAEDWKP